MNNFLSSILNIVNGFSADYPELWVLLQSMLRYLLPLISALILYRCGKPLLTFRKQPEQWAWLLVNGEKRFPVTHWESLIGSSKRSDIVLDYEGIEKSHAVLTRYDDGSWTVSDVGEQRGVKSEGRPVSVLVVDYGENFELSGCTCRLEALTDAETVEQGRRRLTPEKQLSPVITLLLLTAFQICCMLRICAASAEMQNGILNAFAVLMLAEWFLFLLLRFFGQKLFEVEATAFFLCTLGFLVIGTVCPEKADKEMLAMLLGIAVYLVFGWSLRVLDRAKKIRYYAAAAGILLLLSNVIFGEISNGARNWIYIGSISVQPSELVKLCFIFVGASTLDRIVARRNLILFVLYSGIICVCLAYFSDFGSALVFFIAFLVIAYLRSGSFAGLVLVCAAVGYAATLIISFRPYILERFQAWGHVWDYATEAGGYQQTRSLMCIASGGLFGLGPGSGFLKYVAASDTDLVFATVSEEWGLLMAMTMVVGILILAFFVIRASWVARSTFYTIGAAAGVAIFLSQSILNMFGTVDFLPLTGVTFPFVSNGGSSMLVSWGVLAFIKAADTRSHASFAIRQERGD